MVAGRSNSINATNSTIAGGVFNVNNGSQSVIAGGNGNKINIGAIASVISGGQANVASGLESFISGGFNNKTFGKVSFAAGQSNVAGGDNSVTLGKNAKTRTTVEVGSGTTGDIGSFVWSQSGVTSTGSNQVLFEAQGGFGIGTNAPASPLHIKGKGTTFGTAINEVVATIEPKVNTDNVSLAINKVDTATEAALLFSTNKTPNFDIRSTFGGASIAFNGYDSGVQTAMMTIFDKSVDRMDINTNIEPQANNAFRLGSSSFRWSTIFAQNPLDTPSDKRLKKDIKDMDYGLAEILSMRPVTYHWKKGDTKRVNLGLIAQEVEIIVPEIVKKADDEIQTRSMRYAELIPVLIKATQEQQILIEQQQASMQQQSKQIEELKAMVEGMLEINTNSNKR